MAMLEARRAHSQASGLRPSVEGGPAPEMCEMAAARMRVLLLNYEFPPVGGGASTASFQLARSLVSSGHEVHVVTSRMSGSPAYEVVAGISVWRVFSWRNDVQDCGLSGAASYVLSASRRISQLLRLYRYDVVHYFFGLPTGALALTLPRLRRLPSVLSLRGSDVPGYDRSSGMLPVLHQLLHPVSRHIWSSADRIIANSAGLRGLAESFYPDREIQLIPNAVSTELFHPLVQRTHAGGHPLRVLCVARLIARKGVEDLLQAVAKLPEEKIELVLQGSGRDAELLEARASELGITDRVRFAGFRPQSQLASVYSQADIFVLPSHSESCSMALLEAMASGLPVIATRVGGTPELVADGDGGILVPQRDPGALAKALAQMCGQPEMRWRMGRFNRRRTEDCSWKKVSNAYLDEYRRAIEAHRKRTQPATRGRETRS